MGKENITWGAIGAGDVMERKSGPPLYRQAHSFLGAGCLLLALALPVGAEPTDLTQGARWDVGVTNPAPPAAVWPKRWSTFTPWEYEGAPEGRNDDPASFTNVPSNLTLNGISACRGTLPPFARGVLDVTVGQGAPRPGLWAYAFGNVVSDRPQDTVVQVRACGPLVWWLNGKRVLAADKAGRYDFPVSLARGTNLCAVKIESGAREWNLSGSVGPAPPVEARCEFTVNDPTPFVSLLYSAPWADTARLNGQPLPVSIPGLNYEQVALPVTLLKPGRNVLTQPLVPREATLADVGSATGAKTNATEQVPTFGKLLGLNAEDAAIEWGPIITRVTGTNATIVCRCNALVPAVLRLDGREFVSPAGALHRWTVEGLKPGAAYPYTVTPGRGAAQGGAVRTLPAAGPVTIGFAGDPQSATNWQDIARSVKAQRPDVLVLIGDIVGDGFEDDLWTRTFFAPGADLLANVPILAVLGNHDRRTPAFDRVFADSVGGRNWAQDIGNALVIGIDGGLDWAPGGENATWLEATLTANRKPFVFVASHYPVYSSRNHGKLAPDGRLMERPSRIARTQILPILERHRVTAILSGHDHGYERSELPSGLTAIVTAGAGAGFYGERGDSARANPYSKVSVTKHHVSFVKVEGDRAVFTAVTAEGVVIDTRTWTTQARASGATP